MNRTRNDKPRTHAPMGFVDKENQAPAPRKSGQHSPLARQLTQDQFLSKPLKGPQSAATMLKNAAGLEFVKARLLSVGLVLEHDRGKKTLSAVPVTKFFEREVAATDPSPSKKLIKQQLNDNARKVGENLKGMLVDIHKNFAQLNDFELVRAQEASLVLNTSVENPTLYSFQLGQDPSIIDRVARAATHIGFSLIYVPDREAPLAVRPRNFSAVSQSNAKQPG